MTLAGIEVAGASFPVTADSMDLTGFVYEGDTTVTLPGGGSETVMQFYAASGTLTHFSMKLACSTSHPMETYTASGAAIHLTDLIVDVVSFSTTSPASSYNVGAAPRPTNTAGDPPQSATAVSMSAAYLAAASISGPIQNRPLTSC